MEPIYLGKRGRFIFYLALTALVVGVKFISPEPLEKLEWKFQDILYEFKSDSPTSKDISIVNIDNLSVRELGAWPWKEEVVADLIAAIGSADPKTVLLDFPMPEHYKESKTDSGGVADQLFWMKNVIASYDIVPSDDIEDTITNPKYLFRNAMITNSDLGQLGHDQALSVRTVLLPDSAVADFAARMGFTYSSIDIDNILRSEPLVMNYQGYYYPSTSLAAASHFLKVLPEQIVVHGGSAIELGERMIPTNSSGEMHLNFPIGVSFKTLSASDILNQRVNFDNLSGKLVIVTISAGSQTEYYKTPVADETPRYLLTAIATENILQQNYLMRADSHMGLYILALALIGLMSAYSLQKISSIYRVIVVAVGLIALANINFFLFNSFNLLANSIYVALLLVLFLVASPLMGIDYSFLPFLRPKLETDEDEEDSQRKQETRSAVANAIKTMPRKVGRMAIASPAAQSSLNQTVSLDKTMMSVGVQDASHTIAITSAGEATQHISPDELNKTMVPETNADKTAFLEPKDSTAAAPAAAENHPPKPVEATSNETAMFGDLTNAIIDQPIGEKNEVSSNEPDKDSSDPPSDLGAISLDEEPISKAPVTPAEEPMPPVQPKPKVIPAKQLVEMGQGDKTSKLGRYQIEGILGKGAMGLVYGGIDPAIDRKVALKTIRLDFLSDPEEMEEMKKRLFLEAQAAGKLNHPNIVTIYDVGSEGAMQYIAMEQIEGQTLEDMIKREVNFNFKIVARMIHQICLALQYAHDAGIVHRDIKPANLMVLPDYSIKVMDFGIARVESSSMTKTGVAMGTPNYISPEQLQGQKIDGRSDLFSLGIVFYEMLVGERPFKGDNLTSLIYSIVNTEPEEPSKKNPRIPPLFDHIVGKLLKKNPAERYQRASDISAALSDFVQSFATR